MKIVKKIFVLSASAILGLSFCAGNAFAGGIPKKGSKISVTHVSTEVHTCGKLRRTYKMDPYYNTKFSDAIRKSSKSVPLKFEDEILKNLEEEEAKPVDIVSLILSLNGLKK